MKPTLRSLCALTIVYLSLAAYAPAETTPHGEILWDTYGVPHIHGKTEAGVFYGFGYAQAQSHGNLVIHLYGESRGRASCEGEKESPSSELRVICHHVMYIAFGRASQ